MSQSHKPKRRPGRDHHHEDHEDHDDVKVVDVEEEVKASAHAESAETHAGNTDPEAGPRVEIKFAGSEILRAKFPKPFDIAERVAGDWVQGGSFDDLPVENPLAKYFTAKGLRKAKEVEKKVLESPVTEKVAMQALQAGMKAQEIIKQVREKIKK